MNNLPIYDPAKIEKKWQKKWASSKIYRSKEDPKRDKYYVLDMFPYPSGEGLHVGHPKGYIATDVVSRFMRMNGRSVLHPMGFDAFGLPAENYAIKTKTNPEVAVKKNVARFKKQLEILGLDYDWTREINTTDPKYYKWTQWIFLEMWKKGLAYESFEPVNWCPTDKTVLANEDVENGRCERCGTPVEKKPMRQWVLKITDYADRLLKDLDATEQYVIPKLIDEKNPHVPGKKLVERHVAHAIVYDPKTRKYLIIRNKKFGWDTVIIGGIEGDESVVDTARREVREETGYTDLDFKRVLGGMTETHHYAKHKDVNRIAFAQAVYFELKSDARVPIADGEDKDDEVVWIDEQDFVPGKMVNSELPIWLARLKDPSLGVAKSLLDWPESIKESQRNWIGRSEGVNLKFKVKDMDISFEMYDSIPQTFMAQTFTVIAPEHKMLHELVKGTDREKEVMEFVEHIEQKKAREGFDHVKDMEGVFTGRYIEYTPANRLLPIWVASYALVDYGSGIVNCSFHDERDFAFAKKYNIPLHPVKGRKWDEVRKDIIDFIVAKGWATHAVQYKLRDWVFSRQRYWGEPIPLIHCEKCGVVPVPEKDLPLKLPKVKSYEPTGTGESPLASIAKWVNVKCPKCRGKARRETNTMPQWAGSSWYHLRYEDPKNGKKLVDLKKEKYWSPVDLYVGGAEHATRHLIYARFWHKFLYDIGSVGTLEPYKRLQSVGLIMGEDGRKMSKRFGNVVNPDEMVEKFGADSLRVYEMFMGPFDQQIAWSTSSIVGSRRFIERVWKLSSKVDTGPTDPSVARILHKTIKKVSDDIVALRFNTAISTLMIAVNELEKAAQISRDNYETLLQLIAPFAPHVADELWSSLGNKKSIHISPWPKYDPKLAIDDEVTIIIQVNGKVRGSFKASVSVGREELENMARNEPEVQKWLANTTVKKVIVVPNRLVNIVVNS